MNLWWFNIDDFPVEKMEEALHCLPVSVAKEINSYRLLEDRKRKLIARFLVKGYCIQRGKRWSWDNWVKDIQGKPFIEGNPFLNISHSGKLVVVAFSSDSNVGIDIEEIKDIDVEPLAKMLHADEYQYLKNTDFNQLVFYSLWTKKEAFLKATGAGFSNGISRVSVLENSIYFHESKWHFHEINIWAKYTGYVCMNTPINEVIVSRIDYETWSKFINDTVSSKS